MKEMLRLACIGASKKATKTLPPCHGFIIESFWARCNQPLSKKPNELTGWIVVVWIFILSFQLAMTGSSQLFIGSLKKILKMGLFQYDETDGLQRGTEQAKSLPFIVVSRKLIALMTRRSAYVRFKFYRKTRLWWSVWTFSLKYKIHNLKHFLLPHICTIRLMWTI